MCRFLRFIISMAHFSMINSIPISWLYILTVCIRVSNSSLLENILMLSMYIRWLIFCDLWNLYPPVHVLCKYESGMVTTTNRNGDSASPWNIPLWIFTSAKLFPSAVNSTLKFFMVFSTNFMTSPDILKILRPYQMSFCILSKR